MGGKGEDAPEADTRVRAVAPDIWDRLAPSAQAVFELAFRMSYDELAHAYEAAVHAAASASVDAEEEAQLTTPVSNLFSGVAAEAGLGTLRLIRETRLDRTRPDFAALLTQGLTTRQKGFVELKAPSISVDVAEWTGRNARGDVPSRVEIRSAGVVG